MRPVWVALWRLTVLIVMVGMSAACNLHPWQPSDDAAPWVAPDTRAVEYFQAVEHSESVWRDANGRHYPQNPIRQAIEDFLFKTGMVDGWPESHSRNEWGVQRIAPFRFTLVSIAPAVVLMTPFEFGSPSDIPSLIDRMASINDKSCLGILHIINSIECDVDAVYAPGMSWFSPDLKANPEPVAWNGRRAEIPLEDGGVLVLTHDDTMVRTERKRVAG